MKRVAPLNRIISKVFLLIIVILLSTSVSAQQGATGNEWHFYGGDSGNTKYSSLDQIDRENVKELEIAWRWKSENMGPRPDYNLRATPIMIGGILYTTAGSRRAAVAIDARTGETLWMYRMNEGLRGEEAPRPTSGRGVAYWTDGNEARIFLVTPGYHLVALDAKTGRPCQDFGNEGIVDLWRGLGRPVNGGIGSSSPPIVSHNVVVVGAALPSGGAPPQRRCRPATCVATILTPVSNSGSFTQYLNQANSATRPGKTIHGTSQVTLPCGAC